jgi:hypothetical protein
MEVAITSDNGKDTLIINNYKVYEYTDYKIIIPKKDSKQIYYNTVGRENGVNVVKGQFNTQKEALDLAIELNKKFPDLYYDWRETLIKEEPKQEIVGYRLKPSIDRSIVDGILKKAMPIWNDEDKSVYFIRGHVAGSLVAKMKELQVLDLWFTPIYEDEEIKSDWIKDNHLEHYYKEGIMADKPKQETTVTDDLKDILAHLTKMNDRHKVQETLEEAAYQRAVDRNWNPNSLETRRVGNEIIEAVKFGANWQAERMHSEEEVKHIVSEALQSVLVKVDLEQWFKQFKKKI